MSRCNGVPLLFLEMVEAMPINVFPVDTRRKNNVIVTSKRRCFDVMMTLSLRSVSAVFHQWWDVNSETDIGILWSISTILFRLIEFGGSIIPSAQRSCVCVCVCVGGGGGGGGDIGFTPSALRQSAPPPYTYIIICYKQWQTIFYHSLQPWQTIIVYNPDYGGYDKTMLRWQ